MDELAYAAGNRSFYLTKGLPFEEGRTAAKAAAEKKIKEIIDYEGEDFY